ncbi:hypothetical protein ACFQZE_24465 [Paenibacillus sp. GCM10027627]
MLYKKKKKKKPTRAQLEALRKGRELRHEQYRRKKQDNDKKE